MTSTQPPADRKSFRVAIVCALPREADAVTLLFDQFWDDERDLYGRADGDTNTYITGRIGEHDIVLAVLPSMGTSSAAAATASLRSSYTNVKLAILVGICGGVPRIAGFDVFLGDVIVSKAIIQYDYGRQYPGHFDVRNIVEDSLGRANKDIRSLLVVFETELMRERLQTEASKHLKHLQEAARKKPCRANYRCPGMKEDKLYPPEYTHRHQKGCSVCAGGTDVFCEIASKASCIEAGCDPATLVTRERFEDPAGNGDFSPKIFVGRIGSGNTVMKSGKDRDRIAAAHNLNAFEMEGAGVLDEIPCIVVKGICDYADSHKNKVWQDFAAATAASVAKAILGRYAVFDGDRDATQYQRHQGIVQGNVYYNTPHPSARTEVVRVIPYPRNEDLVYRPDFIDRLDELLPQTPGSRSAALWGLGGSGKTQIALDYAYRRCDADNDCCVFWVHADNEATFLSDYKAIGKKLGVDERLDGSDLFDAVRNEIEARPKWLMILDNADDLRLFGVGQGKEKGINESLYKHVPCTSQGTVLWTSRDAHIAGTLVGARRGIEVQSMAVGEATTLLARTRDEPLVAEGEALGKVSGEAGVDALLEELQCLPLAISQAGAYMRRMSISAEQYLSLLRPGKTRWELLKVSDADRHRRPEVSNSILETWRLSIERIRLESEMSYRILHVIAYIDSQDIPQELMVAAASGCDTDDKDSELKVLEAVVRLKEFSFLSLRQTDDGRRYEMHKLVQEAIRYGLRVRDSAVKTVGNASGANSGPKEDEGYYCGKALQVVNDLFPLSEPKSWKSCEQYVAHAIRVSDWAEVSGTEVATSTLLERVSYFLHDRGRWREREPVGSRAWSLRRKVLGEKHPDTISSMANLGATYHALGRHNDAQEMAVKALELRREALGRDKHPDILSSMTDLATTYYTQGQYTKAQGIYQEVLDVRLELLGEKHPDTIKSMADLATAYHALRKYDKAKAIYQEVLGLRLEVFGEKHPAISKSMADLAATCHAQGRHDEAKNLKDKALALRREMLGETHPDTISSIADLGVTYHAYGRYDEALQLHQTALDHRRQLLGENHPDTLQSAAYLASTQDALQQLRSLEQRKPWTRLLSKFKHQKANDLREPRSSGRHRGLD